MLSSLVVFSFGPPKVAWMWTVAGGWLFELMFNAWPGYAHECATGRGPTLRQALKGSIQRPASHELRQGVQAMFWWCTQNVFGALSTLSMRISRIHAVTEIQR